MRAAVDAASATVVVWVVNSDAGVLNSSVNMSAFAHCSHDAGSVVTRYVSWVHAQSRDGLTVCCRGIYRWVTEFSGTGDRYRPYNDVAFVGSAFDVVLPGGSTTTFEISRCS